MEVTLADGTTRQLRGANVIVSTGTRAALDAIPGLAEAQPLTHIEALELDEIPEHLLVVGGGYVGVELSQAMRRFGSKVTIIDRNGRLMSKEDPDVCEALRGLLADEGIDILLNARIKQVSGKIRRLGERRRRSEWNSENPKRKSSIGRRRPQTEHRRTRPGTNRR